MAVMRLLIKPVGDFEALKFRIKYKGGRTQLPGEDSREGILCRMCVGVGGADPTCSKAIFQRGGGGGS